MIELHRNHLWLMISTCLLGVCVGSFLNVLIYRLPLIIQSQTATGYNNSKIATRLWSSRYFIVEITSGLSSLLLAWQFGLSVRLLLSLILLWALITLFFIDLKTMLLPDQITLPLIWLGLFSNIFNNFTSLPCAVLGAISGYLFFYPLAFVMFKIKKMPAIGGGDYKLLAVLGAWLGWQSLPIILLMGSLTGLGYGIFAILTYNKRWSDPIPFGPFLIIGGLICLFWPSP